LVKSVKPKKHSEGFHVSNNNLFSILTGNEKKLLDFYQSVAYKVERYNAKYKINDIAVAVGMSRSTVIRHNRRLETMGYLVVKRAWLDFNRCAINAYTVVYPVTKQPKKLSTASSKLEQLCKGISSCKKLIPKINLDTIVNNDPIVADHNLKISEKKEVGKRLNFAYKPKAEAPLEADLSNLIPMYDDPKPKEKAKAVYKAAGNAVTLLKMKSKGRGIGDSRKAASLLNRLIKKLGADPVSEAVCYLIDETANKLYRDNDTRRILGLIEQATKEGRRSTWNASH
jgi:DNA-binding Lrp family transcriptional regulator